MANDNAPSDGGVEMSFKLVAAVFDMKVGNPLRKMVLIKLADQANDDGICWPSYESIAKSCEISRRSVVTHIQWLADNDFLWIEKRYNAEESKNFSNRYHLTLNKAKQFKKVETSKSKSGANAALGKTEDSDANAALGGAIDSLGGAAPASSNGAGAAPESINKPINESINESGNEGVATKEPEPKSERELMVDSLFGKWLELSGQKIKPLEKRLKHINARLDDGFTPEEIIEVMTFVATDAWHVSNGQNTIEIAIRSTDQMEKKMIRLQADRNKKPAIDRKTDKLAVNNNWENASQPTEIKSTVTFEEFMGEA